MPQNRPRLLLVGIRKDILEACDFVHPEHDPEDAIACGFLPAGEPGKFPDLLDLLGDLVETRVAKILRSGDFPSGAFETTEYPRPPKSAIQKALRSPPHWDKRMIRFVAPTPAVEVRTYLRDFACI